MSNIHSGEVILVRCGHGCYFYQNETSPLLFADNCLTTVLKCFDTLNIKIVKQFWVNELFWESNQSSDYDWFDHFETIKPYIKERV